MHGLSFATIQPHRRQSRDARKFSVEPIFPFLVFSHACRHIKLFPPLVLIVVVVGLYSDPRVGSSLELPNHRCDVYVYHRYHYS